MAGREYTLDKRKIYYKWDNGLPPAIEISWAMSSTAKPKKSPMGRSSRGYPLRFSAVWISADWIPSPATFVKGAEPGDVLEGDPQAPAARMGLGGDHSGLGLLAEDFTEPYIRYFDLINGFSTPLREDIHIPLQPFCGTMGVVTDEPGQIDVLPPTKGAGTSTRATSTSARSSICPSMSKARCFRRAIVTRRRVMAKSASPASNARWRSACASTSRKGAACRPGATSSSRRRDHCSPALTPKAILSRRRWIRPDDQRQKCRARIDRLAGGGAQPQPRGCLHSVQRGVRPEDQPDRRSAKLRRLGVSVTECVSVAPQPHPPVLC